MNGSLARTLAATGLPLVPLLPEIRAALDEKGTLVIRADPGSGKSTLVPLALMDTGGPRKGGGQGKIIMLEPRRAAVLGIASRLAELLGEETGGQAGYAVRLERRVSARTRIEVVTEGLLVRRLQENPGFFDGSAGEPTLIFDEFHERSIHTDLAFALVMDLRRMGAKIRLVVMSATMDAAQVAAFIDGIQGGRESRGGGNRTAVIDCPGRVFPVETAYRPLPRTGPLARECAAALADILRDEDPRARDQGTLVFLPGRREIAVCAEYLAERGFDRDFEIIPLHGSLPLARQRAVIAPAAAPDKRRLILATNVAETGLTIPGIRLVVDSGYVRLQRLHLPSGMNRLSLETVSRNSADQRRGRAGRLGPGRCIRLWAETGTLRRETVPEIERIDLSAAVLDCLLWGGNRPGALPWLEPPPEAAWQRALELLRDLGAADAQARPTELGREIARLGLDPRLGKLCVQGRDRDMAAIACASAALLSERDGSGFDGDDPDFISRLGALRNRRGDPRARQVRRAAEDLLRRLGLPVPLEWTPEDEAGAGELLASAFPGRIAQRRDSGTAGGGIFRFSSGREARINAFFPDADWLCALEVDAGERTGFIRLAVPLSEAAAREALKNQIRVERRIEWKGLVPRTLALTTAGRLVLSGERRPSLREELAGELTPLLRETGIGILPWDDDGGAPRRLLDRIRFFAARRGGEADWSDEALAESAADWLGPFVWDGAGSGKGAVIGGRGLLRALETRLGWEGKQELEKLAPGQFTLPSGKKRPIDYGGGEPALRVRLQDAFGISGNPAILSVPLVFHLLSPADRPIQITRDLEGFWKGSYAEVRREMRGRYPKHRWPENPAAL